MWCSKVLVAYDGSAPSAKALHLARSIGAQDESVELVFAHVVKLYGLGTGAETVLLDEAKKVLVEMEQLADEVPNKAHAHLLKGSSPADLLLKCAQDEGCDLIVMGSRGKGGVKGYLGSVSYAVVQGSPVAVLIAKDAPDAGAVSASTTPAAETPGTGPQGANPSGTSADQAAR